MSSSTAHQHHHHCHHDHHHEELDGTMLVVVEHQTSSNSPNSNHNNNLMRQVSSPTSTTTCDSDCVWDLPFFDSDDPIAFANLAANFAGDIGDEESGVFLVARPSGDSTIENNDNSDSDNNNGGCIPISTGHDAIFITNSDSTALFAYAPCGSCPRRTMSCGSKKNVRFADAQGKPLESIVTFANSPIGSIDSSNNTPIVATPLSRLLTMVQKQPMKVSLFEASNCMEMLFPDPLSSYSVLADKLRTHNVALESVCCRSGFIKGIVRVRNLAYSKHVFVRMTFDAWSSSRDWNCDIYPIVAPTDGAHCDYDLFEFAVPIPPTLMPGTIVQFCICFKCGEGEFWDNNFGQNYSLRYQPQAPSPGGGHVGRIAANLNALNNLKTAESEEERTRRIRDFVWSEFASWSSNNSSNNNDTVVSFNGSNVKHHVITPVDAVNAPKTTAPPTNCVDTPYW